jgi:hypothetical protein
MPRRTSIGRRGAWPMCPRAIFAEVLKIDSGDKQRCFHGVDTSTHSDAARARDDNEVFTAFHVLRSKDRPQRGLQRQP